MVSTSGSKVKIIFRKVLLNDQISFVKKFSAMNTDSNHFHIHFFDYLKYGL